MANKQLELWLGETASVLPTQEDGTETLDYKNLTSGKFPKEHIILVVRKEREGVKNVSSYIPEYSWLCEVLHVLKC
jgi:hypothetical protein